VSYVERRLRLLGVLCLRGHDTYDNLAHEFNVSKMTIRRDITALTCSYPIETVRGHYGGDVKVAVKNFLKSGSKPPSQRISI